ncbi:MAG: hypothetical protein WA090_06340 [Candidatus Nanopelagicaceae bacterium]
MSSHPYRCCFWTGCQWRNINGDISNGANEAGQTPSLRQFGGGKSAIIERRNRNVAVGDFDLAFFARAVATARGVDRNSVPRRCVESADASRYGDGSLARAGAIFFKCAKCEFDAPGAIMFWQG